MRTEQVEHEPSDKRSFFPEASSLHLSCLYPSGVVTQMADCHDNHPTTGPFGRPSSAVPTFGDTTTSQTAGEAASEVASEPTVNNTQVPVKRRSGAWEHYDKVLGQDGKKMVKCCHCDKTYVNSNCGTGNMWKHIRRVHPNVAGVRQLGPGSLGAAYSPANAR